VRQGKLAGERKLAADQHKLAAVLMAAPKRLSCQASLYAFLQRSAHTHPAGLADRCMQASAPPSRMHANCICQPPCRAGLPRPTAPERPPQRIIRSAAIQAASGCGGMIQGVA
jgi:hypothetical protein